MAWIKPVLANQTLIFYKKYKVKMIDSGFVYPDPADRTTLFRCSECETVREIPPAEYLIETPNYEFYCPTCENLRWQKMMENHSNKEESDGESESKET